MSDTRLQISGKSISLQGIALLLIIVFVLAEGLFFITVFPKYQIPDEELYVRNVVDFAHGLKPYFVDSSRTGHPVLYELIIYPAFRLFSYHYFYFFGRFFSLICFIAALVVFFFLGRKLFGISSPLAIAIVAALAFSPQLVFIFSALNSDSLLMLLFTLSLFFLIKVRASEAKILDYLILGVVLVAGFLTKERFVIVLPLMGYVAVARLWDFYKQKQLGLKDLRKPQYLAASVSIIPIAILGLFFLIRYASQEIDLATYATTFSVTGIFRIFKQFWWGYFGLLQFAWPVWLYVVCAFWFLIALAGLVSFFITKESSLSKRWLIVFSVLSFLMGVFVVFYELKTKAGQGRYLFTLAGPIYTLLVLGIESISRRLKEPRILISVFLGFLLVINIYSLVWKTGWLVG